MFGYISFANTYCGVEELTGVSSFRTRLFLLPKWDAEIKFNVSQWEKNKTIVTGQPFQVIVTFSFTFFSAEDPKDVFLVLQLSFWMAESEVQHGLPVRWFIDREGGLMSCVVPGFGVTATTRVVWVLTNRSFGSGLRATIYCVLVVFSLWLWTSTKDSGCCGCLQLVEG